MREQLEREIEAQEVKLNGMSPFSEEYKVEQEKLNELIAKKSELESNRMENQTANGAIYEALEGIPIAFILTTEKYSLEEKITIIADSLTSAFAKTHEVAESLRREVKVREELITELRSERDVANAETFDLQSKLKNASEQLEEEKRISNEKDSEIARLREALSTAGGKVPFGSHEADKEAHKQALESRPAIYDLQWTDTLKKTHYTAKRADTGEQMEPFSRLTLGLYRVLEGEELARFQEEYAAEQARKAQEELERLAAESQNVEAPSLEDNFQDETDAGVSTGEGSTMDRTVDDAPVTREEFQSYARIVNDSMAALARRTGGPITEEEVRGEVV